jgi:hypothetical protein
MILKRLRLKGIEGFRSTRGKWTKIRSNTDKSLVNMSRRLRRVKAEELHLCLNTRKKGLSGNSREIISLVRSLRILRLLRSCKQERTSCLEKMRR